MSVPKTINLLSKEGFEHTPLGKVLTWALTAGRVIVIFTELVVIIAFLSRFMLDRKLTDLYETNAASRLQIESQGFFEKQFRNTQARLALYKKLASSQGKAANTISNIASLLPQGVVLSKISIQDNDLSANGEALSEGGLSGFIKALSDSQKFSEVKLSNINLTAEGGQEKIKFQTSAKIK